MRVDSNLVASVLRPYRRLLGRAGKRRREDSRFGLVDANSFVAQPDAGRQKALFAKTVRLVEIEVHSYCNRVCWFCPNSFIDRRSRTELMNEAVYLRLLADLREVGYDATVTYSRYNEPFAHPIFLERLAQAREALPGALLHTNTNGDYLDDGVMMDAYRAGLRSLNVQLYLPAGQAFSMAAVEDRMRDVRRRAPCVDYRRTIATREWVEYRGSFKDMRIRAYARDFSKNGVHRAGLAVGPSGSRISPCFEPFLSVYVDHTGDVVPCCNIRGDFDEHLPFVLGRLDAEAGSIFRIFAGPGAAGWRRSLIGFSAKKSPCADCRFNEIAPTRANRAAASRLEPLAEAR